MAMEPSPKQKMVTRQVRENVSKMRPASKVRPRDGVVRPRLEPWSRFAAPKCCDFQKTKDDYFDSLFLHIKYQPKSSISR